jgi:hypothetical protein
MIQLPLKNEIKSFPVHLSRRNEKMNAQHSGRPESWLGDEEAVMKKMVTHLQVIKNCQASALPLS